MATIILEGQRIATPDEIAQDDDKLREALAQFFPEAATASFTRQIKEGELTVTVYKRAGTKGTELVLVIQQLKDSPEEIHPARLLAWELEEKRLIGRRSIGYLLGCQPELRSVQEEVSHEMALLESFVRFLRNAPSTPATHVPEGF